VVNEQNIKTECPNIENYIGIAQVINLMHEWIISYDFRFWDAATAAYYGEWGVYKESHLCCPRNMVKFLEILVKIIPDSIHKEFLERYLRIYKGEER